MPRYTAESLKNKLKVAYDALKFEPSPIQWEIAECQERQIFVSGGVRSGKSTISEKYLLGRWDLGYDGEHPLLYWIAGKDYESCQPEFRYCVEDAQKLGICLEYTYPKSPDKSVLVLGLGGKEICRIVTKSLKDELKIMAEAPDGILLVEAAQNTYSAYQKLVERTAQKRSWLLCSGTFEHEVQGWYPESINYYMNNPGGKSFIMPSWSNLAVFPKGREDDEIKRQEALLPADLFMERFGGVPCKPEGVIITEFSHQIHVRDCPFNKDLPVHITTDPGFFGAASVLAIQEQGDSIWIIDEIYLHGRITEEVIDICKKQPWWYARRSGTIDIAARQHQAMASPYEVWKKVGGLDMQSKRVDEKGGIDLLRTMMKPHPISGEPRIIIDPKCKGLICECGGGKPPDLNDNNHNELDKWGPWVRDRLSGKPVNKHNHSVKALIYYLANKVGYRDSSGFKQKPEVWRWSGKRRT
jgi:hypothetical protein